MFLQWIWPAIHFLFTSVELNINTTGLNWESAMNWILCVCVFIFFFWLLYCQNQIWKIHNSEIVWLYLFEIKKNKQKKRWRSKNWLFCSREREREHDSKQNNEMKATEWLVWMSEGEVLLSRTKKDAFKRCDCHKRDRFSKRKNLISVAFWIWFKIRVWCLTKNSIWMKTSTQIGMHQRKNAHEKNTRLWKHLSLWRP